MLTRTKINEHSYEFISRIVDTKNSMLINCAKSPLVSFEAMIQTLINAINRSLLCAYITDQLLTQFFGNNNDHKNEVLNIFILYSSISTLYISLFSRTLNVYKQFFNPKFQEISFELLKNTQVSRFGIFVDISMGLLRGGAASVLLYKHGPTDFPANILLSISIGLCLTLQSVYSRYKSRLNQTALEKKLEKTMNEEIDPQVLENITSLELFDFIKETFKTKWTKRVAISLNLGERTARWLAFMGFLSTMNQLLKTNTNLKLDFYDLFCIQQLLCNPALENEFSFLQDTLVDNLAYYRTKVYLKKNLNHVGSAFLKTKLDYSKGSLLNLLPEILSPKKASETQELNDNQSGNFITNFFNIKKNVPTKNKKLIAIGGSEIFINGHASKIPSPRNSRSERRSSNP